MFEFMVPKAPQFSEFRATLGNFYVRPIFHRSMDLLGPGSLTPTKSTAGWKNDRIFKVNRTLSMEFKRLPNLVENSAEKVQTKPALVFEGRGCDHGFHLMGSGLLRINKAPVVIRVRRNNLQTCKGFHGLVLWHLRFRLSTAVSISFLSCFSTSLKIHHLEKTLFPETVSSKCILPALSAEVCNQTAP